MECPYTAEEDQQRKMGRMMDHLCEDSGVQLRTLEDLRGIVRASDAQLERGLQQLHAVGNC